MKAKRMALRKFNKNKKFDNSGTTLIELIVALIVSSLVMLALVFFVTVSTNQYGNTNADVAMQMESQTALNQIADIVMEGTTVPEEIVTSDSDIIAYAFDSLNHNNEKCAQVLVLNKTNNLVLTAELSQTDILGTEEDAGLVGSDSDNSLETLASKISESTIEMISNPENKQKYMLAGHINELVISTDNDTNGMVKVSLALDSGKKTQAISGSYKIRNTSWAD